MVAALWQPPPPPDCMCTCTWIDGQRSWGVSCLCVIHLTTGTRTSTGCKRSAGGHQHSHPACRRSYSSSPSEAAAAAAAATGGGFSTLPACAHVVLSWALRRAKVQAQPRPCQLAGPDDECQGKAECSCIRAFKAALNNFGSCDHHSFLEKSCVAAINRLRMDLSLVEPGHVPGCLNTAASGPGPFLTCQVAPAAIP